MAQLHDSAATSLNQVPAAHKLIEAIDGYWLDNLDIGGGKYNAYTDALWDIAVVNDVYDPFNRSKEHNEAILNGSAFRVGYCSVTCNNVLNVIKEPEVRRETIELAYKAVQEGRPAYFTVYEGNRSGEGKISRKSDTGSSWQNNMKTADYMPELQAVFGAGNVTRKGKLLIAVRG